MKRVILFLSAVGVLALAGVCVFFFMSGKDGGPEEKFEGKLRVGMECDYAPYNWQEDKASDTNVPLANRTGLYAEGYDVQMAKAIAEQMGVEMEIDKVPWDTLLSALKDKQIDVIISGMADLEERKALPDYSASQTYNVNVAEYCVVLKEDSRYRDSTTLVDFYGARLVGQKGSRLDTVIDQIPGVNHLTPTDTFSQMLEFLMTDKADGIVLDLDSAETYLKEYPGLAVARFTKGQGFELGFTGICVWTRREDKALLKAVNKAIDGIPSEIRQKLLDLVKAKIGA